MSAIATARLGRYGLWQLRDYLRGAGGAMLAVCALAIAVLSSFKLGHVMVASESNAESVSTVNLLIGALGLFGPLFACSGLVADDRSRGYYRFLLAKPVSPVRLYAQAFVLRGLAFLAIAAAFRLACTVMGLTSGAFAGTMAYLALCYLMVGGVTLMVSTIGRHAWLAVLGLYVAAGLAATWATVGTSWRPLWVALHAVLPPFQLASRLASALVSGDVLPFPLGYTAWFAGYGLLAIAVALTVIRGREWSL